VKTTEDNTKAIFEIAAKYIPKITLAEVEKAIEQVPDNLTDVNQAIQLYTVLVRNLK